MSKLNFLHEVKNRSIKNDQVEVHEEIIIDGPKGVTIKYYHKDAAGIEKISIFGKDDSYKMTVISGGEKKDSTLSKSELTAELAKNKKLSFAKGFKLQKGGSRKIKKGSKSGSKSGSKKRGLRKGKRGSK